VCSAFDAAFAKLLWPLVYLVFGCAVVEPPELLHMSYAVEQPKVEVPPEQLEESDMKLDKEMTTSKSSLKSASKSKVKPEEAKQEVKPQDAAKSEMPKEKKDVERPPIFVTLQ